MNEAEKKKKKKTGREYKLIKETKETFNSNPRQSLTHKYFTPILTTVKLILNKRLADSRKRLVDCNNTLLS